MPHFLLLHGHDLRPAVGRPQLRSDPAAVPAAKSGWPAAQVPILSGVDLHGRGRRRGGRQPADGVAPRSAAAGAVLVPRLSLWPAVGAAVFGLGAADRRAARERARASASASASRRPRSTRRRAARWRRPRAASAFGYLTTAYLVGLAVSPVVAGFIGRVSMRAVFFRRRGGPWRRGVRRAEPDAWRPQRASDAAPACRSGDVPAAQTSGRPSRGCGRAASSRFPPTRSTDWRSIRRRPPAVRALFDLKGRAARAALPFVAASASQVERSCGRCRPLERAAGGDVLAGAAVARARRAGVDRPRGASAGRGSIAIRVPAHPRGAALAEAWGRPLPATSANRSGEPPASRAERRWARSGARPACAGHRRRRDARRRAVDDRRRARRRARRSCARARSPWNRVLDSLEAMSTRGAVSNEPPVERAALVGLVTTRATRRPIRTSTLEELAGLARSGRRRRSCCAPCRNARAPIRRTFIGKGKAEQLARRVRRSRRHARHRRQRAHAGAGAQPRKGVVGRRVDRSHGADSRHLRAARAHARRPAAGRAGAAAVPAAAADGVERGAVAASAAASARAAPARRSSRPIAAAFAHRISRAQARDRRRRGSGAATCARGASRTDVPTVALVGYTNAGKTHAVQPADRRRRGRVGRAVRHARSAGAPGQAARRPPDHAVRHGRVHRPAAAPAGGGVSRDARGSRAAPTCCVHVIDASARGPRAADRTPCARCSTEVGAADVPMLDVFNKCDLARAVGARSAEGPHPDAVFISARDGHGPDRARRGHRRRLAMDAERVRFALDGRREARSPPARRPVSPRARRQPCHRRTHRVSIEADVPRRLSTGSRARRVPA